MAAPVNVGFYEKIKELQEVQHDSEQQRIELDQQLHSYMKSDNRLVKLKTVRLQNYWKKICEDEKKSQWRNEQLLKDLERVETHLTALSAKTDRLRSLKQQYEDYIEQTYPHWKEQVVLQQRQRQAEEDVQRQLQLQQHQKNLREQQGIIQQNQNLAAKLAADNHAQMSALMQSANHPAPLAQSTGLLEDHSNIQVQPAAVSVISEPSGVISQARDMQSLDAGQSMSHVNEMQKPGQIDVPLKLDNHEMHIPAPKPIQTIPPSAGSTMQTVSSIPTSTWNSVAQDRVDIANTDGEIQHVKTEPTVVIPHEIAPSSNLTATTSDLLTTTKTQPDTQQVSGMMSGALSDDDFSDISLPSGGHNVPKPIESAGKPSPSPRSSVKRMSSHESSSSPRSKDSPTKTDELVTAVQAATPSPRPPEKLRPDITVEGFCNLLQGLEQTFRDCMNPDEYYNILTPAPHLKQNIVVSANKGDNLMHYDPTALSMVALNQLPLLNINTEGGCLIPDKVLINSVQATSEEIIRPHIHPASLTLWNALFDHFIQILRYKIMSPQSIADIFSPHIIDPESPYEARAKSLLTNVLVHAPLDDGPLSPGSTTTFNEMQVTPKPQIPMQKPTDVPPLNLGIDRTSSDFNDTDKDAKDSMLGNTDKQETNNMPLSQSAAYQALLSGTLSQTAQSQFDVDEDTDDDIEQQLGSMLSPRRKSKGSLPTSPVHKTVSKNGVRSPASSAGSSRVTSPTPVSPAGYVPSAIDQPSMSMNSLGSTAKSSKKPAFMYEDSDEDIDIPMGTGGSSIKHGEEKDDFDFYD